MCISFYTSGKMLVDKWSYLGHVISKDGDDKFDIGYWTGKEVLLARQLIYYSLM